MMEEISELEQRITAALERIAHAVDSENEDKITQSDEFIQLREAYEKERIERSELQAQLQRVESEFEAGKQSIDAESENSKIEIDRLKAQLDAEEKTMAELRRSNDQLREITQALRDAAQTGVVEAHLINKSMMAELDGLRVSQSANRVELNAVMGEIEGLMNLSEAQSTNSSGEAADA